MSDRWDSDDRGHTGYNPLLAMPDKLGEPLELVANSLAPRFRPLRTPWLSSFLIVFCFIYGIACIWAFSWTAKSDEFQYNAMLHAAYFFCVAVMDRMFFGMHKSYQAAGYLRLYRQTNLLRQVPYLVASVANALLLLLWGTVSLQDVSCEVRSMLLKILVCTETVVVIGCMIMYTVIVTRHNMAREMPDAQKSLDHSMMTPMVDDASWDPSGTWKGGPDSSVVSRQADMIKFLQEQQQNLSREILVLNDRLKHAEMVGSPDKTKDESVLVAQKEQERRYLQVERDELEDAIRVLKEEAKSHQGTIASLRKTVREQAAEISKHQRDRGNSTASRGSRS